MENEQMKSGGRAVVQPGGLCCLTSHFFSPDFFAEPSLMELLFCTEPLLSGKRVRQPFAKQKERAQKKTHHAV